MLTGAENTRELQAIDCDAVDNLLRLAFAGPEEADLVRALRNNGDIETEIVLTLEGRVIGYYALPHMVSPKKWLCLAPVAIHPNWQRKGHGQLMISKLCDWARNAARNIVVLGQVAFYEKAGFSPSRAARLTSPYPIKHTMLAGPGKDAPIATLVYPQAFAGL